MKEKLLSSLREALQIENKDFELLITVGDLLKAVEVKATNQ